MSRIEPILKVVALMTRKVLGSVLGAVLAVMVAPGALAHADGKDVEFNNYLSSNGIHMGSAPETANMGHTLCQDLDSGYTQKDEIDQLTQRVSQAQARLFVLAAVAEYCPEKHGKS
jgi:hypothetical protein